MFVLTSFDYKKYIKDVNKKMSCVWDGIRDAIRNDYTSCEDLHLRRVFSHKLRSDHLPNFFVLNNQICDKVTVNDEEITEQFKMECKKTIETLANYPIYTGYLCSTCDPLLLLVCQIFRVHIRHTHFNGVTTIYRHKEKERCVYNFESNRTHFWYINKYIT